MNNGKTFKVKNETRIVEVVEEYSNGMLTTGGFFEFEELEEVNSPNITYSSEFCTELPVNWHDLYFLDDNGNRQKIKSIRFGEEPAYIMEDGTLSREVEVTL